MRCANSLLQFYTGTGTICGPPGDSTPTREVVAVQTLAKGRSISSGVEGSSSEASSASSVSYTSSIVQHQHDLCESLQLKGRIRVANEGINGCLSGLADAIHQYINSFENDPEYAPLKAKGNVHWKIGYPNTTSNIPLERQQFDKLSVKVTKEVVSLNLSAEEMEVVKSVAPGIHLQPLDFHNMLRNESQDDIVVLDVRNVYETQIGHFDYYNSVGEVGSAIDPCTRSYSDFAEWCKRNKEVLKGDKTNAKPKKILMYCTGGVRCERASQYVKSVLLAEDEKSLAENVFQLYGGIQNYMDTLGEKGTLFRGKNFVYDNRIAVGSEVVGSCVVCAGSFDDYSYQTRCTKCRMLLLVCVQCQQPEVLQSLVCNSQSCKK